MNNHKGLRLYIGHQEFGDKYYINTKGEHYIDKYTIIFPNINSLLKHLISKYSKRKASLVVIENNIRDKEKEEILKTIKKNNLKIEISKNLEDKFS